MSMPALASRRWTRAEVLALIDSNPLQTPRYELVDGELLVTPSPVRNHQRAVRELMLVLHPYVERHGLGEVLASPSDAELEPETVVQPDLYVLPTELAPKPTREPTIRQLLVAIEVLSPGSMRHDRGEKRLLYQRTVPEYWIIDLDARLIERWQPQDARPEILRDRLVWHPSGADVAFVLELDAYFAKVIVD